MRLILGPVNTMKTAATAAIFLQDKAL